MVTKIFDVIFCWFFQDICFNQALPSHIRWIGILSFKNGIEKYWRRAINRSVFRKKVFDEMKRFLNQ